MFWNKVSNKVSRGIAEKNFINIEQEWIEKAEELAICIINIIIM
jgi:hypothetical protein